MWTILQRNVAQEITQKMGLSHVHLVPKENIRKIMNNISVLNVLLVQQLDTQELVTKIIVLTKVCTIIIIAIYSICDYFITGQIPSDYTPGPFPTDMDPANVPAVPLKV